MLKWKKIKDTFGDRQPVQSVPSFPSKTRALRALAVKFGALDPEGSLSGNEHYLRRNLATFKLLIFYKRNSLKIRHTTEINSVRKFIKEMPLKMNQQTIIENWEFAFNSIWELPLKRKTFKTENSPSILHKNPFKT